MSGTSQSAHPQSSQASPSFSLKRDAAVQYGSESPAAQARQNPLFEQGSGGQISIQREYAAPNHSPRGAPRDAGVQFTGGPGSNLNLNSTGYPDSPPRRKGPQPSGMHHLRAGAQRQDQTDPGFKQMYSPSNPPQDTGSWTPRGKGFVTII